jgi:hypothetical protein
MQYCSDPMQADDTQGDQIAEARRLIVEYLAFDGP